MARTERPRLDAFTQERIGRLLRERLCAPSPRDLPSELERLLCALRKEERDAGPAG